MNFWLNPKARILLKTQILNASDFRIYKKIFSTQGYVVTCQSNSKILTNHRKNVAESLPLLFQEVSPPQSECLVVMDPNVFHMLHTAFILAKFQKCEMLKEEVPIFINHANNLSSYQSLDATAMAVVTLLSEGKHPP